MASPQKKLAPAPPLPVPARSLEALTRWQELVRGQAENLERIWPYLDIWDAGLNAPGRPAGVFFLAGPSGSGKSFTVEALAQVLHGDPKSVLRVDCGEYQLDHEVAKLQGSPPGYLGHRETAPLLTQSKLNAVTSQDCGLSLVLFDEVEKGASSLHRLLLGILDKGTLKLGDNTTVNFERSLVFFTSNLGARELVDAMGVGFGLEGASREARDVDEPQARALIERALAKKFPPEFKNRLDEVLVYRSLTKADHLEILRDRVDEFNEQLFARTAEARCPVQVRLRPEAEEWLVERGFTREFGARGLKRTLVREVRHTVARALREVPRDAQFFLASVGPNGLEWKWVSAVEAE